MAAAAKRIRGRSAEQGGRAARLHPAAVACLAFLLLAAPAADAFVGQVPVHSANATTRLQVTSDATLAGWWSDLPTPVEALPGALASGWGACVGMTPGPGGSGSGGECVCPAALGTLCPAGLSADAESATTGGPAQAQVRHAAGRLTVVHDWRAAPELGPDAVEVAVTLANTGTAPLRDAVYRRTLAMAWSPSAGQAFEFAARSILLPLDAAPPALRYSSDGVTSPNPRDPWDDGDAAGAAYTPCALRLGPGTASAGGAFDDSISTACGSGVSIDLALGDIPAGGSLGFRMLHGHGANDAAARARLDASGLAADVAVLVQEPSTSGMLGGPALFWAFAGLPTPVELPEGCGTGCRDPCPDGAEACQAPTDDADGDGIADSADNCPSTPNRSQADADGDGAGDACEAVQATSTGPAGGPGVGTGPAASDADLDGVADPQDNCPANANRGQEDLDADRLGDACDDDADGDGAPERGPAGALLDNCPGLANPGQEDADGDGTGDACGGAGPSGAAPGSPPALAGQAVAPAQLAPLVLALLAGAAAVAVLAWASRRWRWLVALPLFSRLSRDRLLDHPVRVQLLDLVEAEPGLHVQELARRTAQSRSTVLHHLRMLAGAGLVRSARAGGRMRHYPAGNAGPTEGPLGEAAQRILAAATAQPGATVAQLAGAAGLAYGAAHYHVRRLEAQGRVALRNDGVLRVHPAAAASGGSADGAGAPQALMAGGAAATAAPTGHATPDPHAAHAQAARDPATL